MPTIMLVLQVILAAGLLNVWLLRSGRRTPYRGGNATTMTEEFAAYGLPDWLRQLVGALKIAAALALIAGIWIPAIVVPTVVLVAALMLGALAMHVKVGDSIGKSVPALLVLALCIAIFIGARAQHA